MPAAEMKETHAVITADGASHCHDAERWSIWLFLVPILLLMTAALSPALVNAFQGDDFLHLQWLIQGTNNNELKALWDNFAGTCLGSSSVKFYRPLVTAIWWLDYKIWGFNAGGYHLTNIVFHAASVVLLLFVGQRLALLAGFEKQTARTIGIFGSLLFAVYPLSPEVVAWITGRVDVTVTAFTLASLLTYLQWRENGRARTIMASLALFGLALICKEMAIVLPVLLVLIDFLFSDGTLRSRLRSWPFWATLGAYFGLRQLTMGTMVGAYSDSLHVDFKDYWHRFRTGLPFIVLPFNLGVFHRQDLVFKAWSLLLAAVSACGAWRFGVQQRGRAWRFYLLCVGWFVISLIPVYKVFNISQTLECSRYGYLATIPLCLALAALAAPLWKRSVFSVVQIVLFGGIISISAYALHAQTQVWSNAGQVTNHIRDEIAALTKNGARAVVMVGAPDNINGGYVIRNALPGLVTRPYFPGEPVFAHAIERYCPLWPFAVVRDAWAQTEYIKFVRWDETTEKLVPVTLTASPTGEKSLPLGNIQIGGGQGQPLASGFKVTAPQKFTICSLNNLHEKCAHFDFVELVLSGTGNDKVDESTMIYVNDMHPNPWPTASSLVRPITQTLPGDRRRLVFSLRQHPEWAVGGNCRQLIFGIPSSDYTIESVKGLSREQLIPVITLPGTAGVSGFLTAEAKPVVISVVREKGRALVLELSACNGNFEREYVTQPDAASKLVRYAVDEPLAVDKHRVNAASGIYQARVWIADAQGKTQGLSSDPFMLVVP